MSMLLKWETSSCVLPCLEHSKLRHVGSSGEHEDFFWMRRLPPESMPPAAKMYIHEF
jgi:hypothetical protein